jgi:hypothetical protein
MSLIRLEHGTAGTYVIREVFRTNGEYPRYVDGERRYLPPSDWYYPGLAMTFGYSSSDDGGCRHDRTDGTVDCPDCGYTVGDFIDDSRRFLDQCVEAGTVAEDPGYLVCDE